MTASLQIQQAPPPQDYSAAHIQVPANIATPQATMDNVKAQQSQLNAVNNFTGGSRRARQTQHKRDWKPKSFIRTQKGRRYREPSQKGGSTGAAIPIPQVGSTCSSGPNCAGAQNATFTALNNQASANGANDAYAAQSGGRRGRVGRKVRFSKHHRSDGHRRSHSQKPRHDQSLTTMIAYNIKKVMRKVFS